MRLLFFFFFNDTATTEIYTLSLHDALPICRRRGGHAVDREDQLPERAPGLHQRRHPARLRADQPGPVLLQEVGDRKSTRLNSSHANISYAVFCLKKKQL